MSRAREYTGRHFYVFTRSGNHAKPFVVIRRGQGARGGHYPVASYRTEAEAEACARRFETERYANPNPVSDATVGILLASAAVVGIGAYFLLKAAPASNPNNTPPGTPAAPAPAIPISTGTIATPPAAGSITTIGQWNQLTEAAQVAYVASLPGSPTYLYYVGNVVPTFPA